MEFTGKFSVKFRAAIKEKLTELSSYVDDELPDYIMVMVANRKDKDHMAKDLALFLGQNTGFFIDWLMAALLTLEAGGDAPLAFTNIASSSTESNKGAPSVSQSYPLTSSSATLNVVATTKSTTVTPAQPPSAPIAASLSSLVAAAPAPSTAPSASTGAPPPQQQPYLPTSKINSEDSERKRRPRSPTPPPDRHTSNRDRRRTPPATSATSLRRMSSSGGKRDERERNRSGRRRRSRSRSRSRTRSRSRERHIGEGAGVSSNKSRHPAPLKAKNMLMKAMSEAERSVKVIKRDTEVAAAPTSSAPASSSSAVAEPLPLAAQYSTPASRSNGGLSERIRDRLGEQRPRSRSRSPRSPPPRRSRSRSVPRSPPRDRRRRRGHQRRRHRGSRSRSRTRSPSGRRRRSHSRQRRSSRGGGTTAPSSTSKPSGEKRTEEVPKPSVPVPEETKKVMLVSDPTVVATSFIASAAVAPEPVFIPAPVPVPVPMPTLAPILTQTSAVPPVKEAAQPPLTTEPQFVVTLTGAGDRYRQLADRLGGCRIAELEECADDELQDDSPATGADMEQLAEEIIEFEEFEEEVLLPQSYKLLIGDSDTEDEQSPAKKAAAAATAEAANANRPSGGLTTGAPAQQNQAKQRCRYWPVCKLGLACPYWHPVEPCKTFPNCKFWNTCLFIHPPCRFQAMCANPLCPYMHSTVPGPAVATAASIPVATAPIMTPTVAQATRPSAQLKCRFFPNCTNMSCPFFHPTSMCRYGLACTNQQACLFNHPTLPSRNKLVWTKSTPAQGPPQAEPTDSGASANQLSAINLVRDAKQSSSSSSTVRPAISSGKIKLR